MFTVGAALPTLPKEPKKPKNNEISFTIYL